MLLVDASFFIALADPKDQWHVAAKGLAPFVRRHGPSVTHTLVIGEVVAVVAPGAGGKTARLVYESIVDTNEIKYPSRADLDQAMEQVVRFDGGLSLSDALLLLYAGEDPKHRVVSFDQDFDGKGVTRISKAPAD